MKPVVANWHRATPCMRIECLNGFIARLAKWPLPLKMSGVTYGPGYDFTGFNSGTGFAPGSLDLKGVIKAGGATEVALVSGVFDNADVYVFATDWSNPVEDEEEMFKGILGKIRIDDSSYIVEVMNQTDLYNQAVGDDHAAQCWKKFGSPECGVDAVALRVAGEVDSLTSQKIIVDATLTQDDDYFGWGKLWFTSGLNVGIPPRGVKTFASGTIELYDFFPYLIAVGDDFIVEPGCRKRLEDCRDKYNNILNDGGYRWIPGPQALKLQGLK